MHTAKLIRDHLPGYAGHAALYELSEPLDGHRLVIVSAVNHFAHETYIFPGDAEGHVTDYSELEGSTRGTTSHDTALFNAGYEVLPVFPQLTED